MLVKSIIEVVVDENLSELVQADLKKDDGEKEKEVVEQLWVKANQKENNSERS